MSNRLLHVIFVSFYVFALLTDTKCARLNWKKLMSHTFVHKLNGNHSYIASIMLGLKGWRFVVPTRMNLIIS